MKLHRRFLGVVVFAVCATALYAHAEISASEKKKIVELMDVLGAKNISRQVAKSFATQLSITLKQAQPSLDQKAFAMVADVTDEIFEARSAALLEKMIPLYDKHFTEAEIDELLAYYHSPIGKKLIETMPALMEESMQIAVDDSKASIPEIQKKVTAKLREEGLLEEKPAAK